MRFEVLTPSDLDRIHVATLKVLEQTGVWFEDCPEAQNLLTEHGCRVEGGRVRFPASVVKEGLDLVPPRESLDPFFVPSLGYAEPLDLGRGKVHFGLVGNAYYLYDYAAGSARDCLETDVRDKLLVLDGLHNFEHDCCNLFTASERGIGQSVAESLASPQSAARFLREWVCARAVADRKRLPLGVRNCTRQQTLLSTLGHAIIEGVEATRVLLEEGCGFPWVNPQSPLQYKAHDARAIIGAARDGHSWNQVSPEVMFGGTGPVTLAGSLVQHNAEVLAGLVLAQFARPGAPFIYGCVSAPMDLRTAEISHGHYETALFNAAVVQIADAYGLPSRISPGNTSDRRPGPRALAETAIGLYMGVAAGGSLITTGLLDSTVMISLEHLVAVDELINQVHSATAGIATDSESIALEVIGEFGHPGGNFLTAEHTRRFMRRDVYYSDFCGRSQTAFEDVYATAHRRVNDILARRMATAHVDRDILARLAAVEARLSEDDVTWRKDHKDWWAFYIQDL